jgi:MFS family permease
MLVSGWAMVIAFASGNTLLQTIVEDDKRGRIMSLFGTAIMGMAPFGSLMAGAVADRFGPIVALIVFGSMALVVGGAMALSLASIRRKIHPILERKGIGVTGVVSTEL